MSFFGSFWLSFCIILQTPNFCTVLLVCEQITMCKSLQVNSIRKGILQLYLLNLLDIQGMNFIFLRFIEV